MIVFKPKARTVRFHAMMLADMPHYQQMRHACGLELHATALHPRLRKHAAAQGSKEPLSEEERNLSMLPTLGDEPRQGLDLGAIGFRDKTASKAGI